MARKNYVALGNPAGSPARSRPFGRLDPPESGSAAKIGCPTYSLSAIVSYWLRQDISVVNREFVARETGAGLDLAGTTSPGIANADVMPMPAGSPNRFES